MSLSYSRARAEIQGQVRETATRVLFGDRYGLVVFLSCLCLFGVVWRTDVFITDSYTLANGLYALTNGEVFMTEAAYGGTLDTPGAEQAPGGLIARNYGAIVLSLPFWAVLEGLTAVTSLRVALVGLWSLALLALVVQGGAILDSERVVVGGSLAVLALFGANVALGRTLDPSNIHFYALQLFHMTVAAFAPVLLYRLLRRIHGRRLGTTGAALLLFGTPLAVWAPYPKRHALTATVVLAVAYGLYRSRTGADGALLSSPVWFRALAYAVVGLYAWVHAPEALLLCLVLLAVDVPTAPDNSARSLAIVGGAFLVSLLPFFITNTVLIGSPLRPPRLLAVRGAGGGQAVAGAGSGPAGSGSTGTGGSGTGGLFAVVGQLIGTVTALLAPVTELVRTVATPVLILGDEIGKGFVVLRERPTDLYHTFVRSGDAAGALNVTGAESVNLAVLESAPLLGATAGVLPVAWRRLKTASLPERTLPGRTIVDIFAALVIVTLTLQYASRLPLHAQVTVRYLFPVFPLGVYLLCRLSAVRRALTEHWRLFAWTAAGVTLIGGQLLVVVVHATVVGLGEAFQLHALLALPAATSLGLWALFGRGDGQFGRVGAVLLGLATALTTLFVLLVAVEYYPLGDSHLLPLVGAVAELLDLL
jgi:hypothetical protein